MFKIPYIKDEHGNILIHCPQCSEKQILPINEDWYEIDIQGNVIPIFVCMAKDRKCNCMMNIKLEKM